MKKLYIYPLALMLTALLSSCFYEEGPPGPRGYDGFDGLDGLNGEESFVFEYELSFTAPDYSALLELPNDFEMLDSDVMLVYLLWEGTEDGVEIWRPLSQRLYFQDGILDYNFDFTKYDARIFLDGEVNLDALGSDYTDNWIARVVVVPGQFAGRSTINFEDYNAVKSHFNLSDSKRATPDYIKRPR